MTREIGGVLSSQKFYPSTIKENLDEDKTKITQLHIEKEESVGENVQGRMYTYY